MVDTSLTVESGGGGGIGVKPECDNVMLHVLGCNTLSHEGVSNLNTRNRMLYRHCYIPS